jgi:hypothetical protein
VIQPLDIEAMLNQPLNPRYKEILDLNFTEKDIDQPALIIHRYIFYFCVIMQN